jgi:hypothetical protein
LFRPSHPRQSEATLCGTVCESPQSVGKACPHYISKEPKRVKAFS